MRLKLAIFIIFFQALFLAGTGNADEMYLGLWASSEKEVLNITKNGDALTAEFNRESVTEEFENVKFQAQVRDGELIIKGEQGALSARYDADSNRLILGGMKAFQRLSPAQAEVFIQNLQNR